MEKLQKYIASIRSESISEDRQRTLRPLIDFIQQKVKHGQAIRLNFICTHNSRRSHLAQIWAQVMSHHFKVPNVDAYSGGTEATSLFPMIAETLERTGFSIKTIAHGDNPIYAIKYDQNEFPIIGFSKLFDDAFNPSSAFCAIMTCDSANEHCPFVPGAEKRIAITYDDPKAFDHTDQQEKKYLERSHQIATEMFYVFSQINLKDHGHYKIEFS